MNLEEWFASNSNVVHIPTQLHVLLTTEGVRQCKSVPYLEEFVIINEDGTGYIIQQLIKEKSILLPLYFIDSEKNAKSFRTDRIDRWFTYTCERNFTYVWRRKKLLNISSFFRRFVSIILIVDEYRTTNDFSHSYPHCH